MDYIKKNIVKLNFIIILSSILLLPILFYVNFNYSSVKTYEKKFYVLKAKDPSFAKKTNLTNKPIINNVTLNKFIEDSITAIFNYKALEENEEEHLKKIEEYFTTLGYSNFEKVMKKLLRIERDYGVIISKSMIDRGPYLLGTAKIIGGQRLWKYTVSIIEIKKGLGANSRDTKKLEIILKETNFSKNNKGVAIDSIVIK